MEEVPSLISLCSKTIERAIIHGCDNLHNILELPLDLLDSLIPQLPPLALQKLHEEMTLNELHSRMSGSTDIVQNQKRHRRYVDLNEVWKKLFKSCWPDNAKHTKAHNFMKNKDHIETCESMDWQQLYWERHLQRCLDEASETALLPGFNGCIGEIILSDAILESLGCKQDTFLKTTVYKRLSFHCLEFGRYARHLRLHNVLCVAETCELLSSSCLQDVVFFNIKTQAHVEGVCSLISQKTHTLLSLSFIHCKFPPTALDEICTGISKNGTEHVIQHLSFLSSSIFGSKSGSLSGFLHFLSSQRSLISLMFSDTQMRPIHASLIMDALFHSSSALSTFEISDNNITGWLSKAYRGSGSTSSTCLPYNTCFKSLNVLDLRANNLGKDDAEDLKLALLHMPNLSALDISENPLTDEGISDGHLNSANESLLPYFSETLAKSNILSNIKIENCNLTSSGAVQLLMTLSSSKRQISYLSIAENDLGRCVALSLANLLRTSSVRELNIEDIGLGPSGFQELQENLERNMELIYLNISKNRGGIEAARFISKVIMQASGLLVVDASHNCLPSESLGMLYDALHQSRGKLKQLNLTGNNHLCQTCDKSPKITSFCFHGKPVVILPSISSSAAPYDDDP